MLASNPTYYISRPLDPWDSKYSNSSFYVYVDWASKFYTKMLAGGWPVVCGDFDLKFLTVW